MNTFLNLIKKIILETALKTIVVGAFLGVLVGIGIAFVGYSICDLYQLPYITQLQANPNIEMIITLYFGGWGIAGIIAKILPW